MPKKQKTKKDHWSDNIIGDNVTSIVSVDKATVSITIDFNNTEPIESLHKLSFD